MQDHTLEFMIDFKIFSIAYWYNSIFISHRYLHLNMACNEFFIFDLKHFPLLYSLCKLNYAAAVAAYTIF